MKITLYVLCWFTVLLGIVGIIGSHNVDDAIVGGILYIPALFSLVCLATHK